MPPHLIPSGYRYENGTMVPNNAAVADDDLDDEELDDLDDDLDEEDDDLDDDDDFDEDDLGDDLDDDVEDLPGSGLDP